MKVWRRKGTRVARAMKGRGGRGDRGRMEGGCGLGVR